MNNSLEHLASAYSPLPRDLHLFTSANVTSFNQEAQRSVDRLWALRTESVSPIPEDKPSQVLEWMIFESLFKSVRPVYSSELAIPHSYEPALVHITETSGSDFEVLSIEGDVPSGREVVLELELDLVEVIRSKVEALSPEVEVFLRSNDGVIGPLSTILDTVPEYLESRDLDGLVELELNVDSEIPDWVVLNVVVLIPDVEDYGRIIGIWKELGGIIEGELKTEEVPERRIGDRGAKTDRLSIVVRSL